MRWITGLVVSIIATSFIATLIECAWPGSTTQLPLAAEGLEDTRDEEDDRMYQDAPPIIPDGSGFGILSYAGSGRHRRPFHTNIIRVTRLDDSGRGSLRDCVDYRGPRTCIFEVGGEIRLRSALRVRSPYLTIAGQTAPNPGITLSGGTLRIETNDVLVQHIAVRPGDARGGVPPALRDGIAIGAEPPRSAHHIVIDHVSVSWALDENISTWYRTTRNVTISNSIIAEGLDNSIHPKGAHSKGLMIGDGSRRISIVGNLIASNIERNPYLKPGTTVEFVNNVVYGWGSRGGWSMCNVSDNDGRGEPVLLSFIGNYYKPGPWSYLGAPLYGGKLADRTRIFTQGNLGPTRRNVLEDEWKISAIPEIPHRSSAAPFRSARMKGIPANLAYERTLTTVGSRPRRRSAIDRRIVEDVRSGTGSIKDCISGCRHEVGSLSSEEPTSSALTLPQDPFGQEGESGYTRLERWLYSLTEEAR